MRPGPDPFFRTGPTASETGRSLYLQDEMRIHHINSSPLNNHNRSSPSYKNGHGAWDDEDSGWNTGDDEELKGATMATRVLGKPHERPLHKVVLVKERDVRERGIDKAIAQAELLKRHNARPLGFHKRVRKDSRS